jgi:hypothetical protein
MGPPFFVMVRFMRAIQVRNGMQANGKLDGSGAPGRDGGER